MFSNVALVFVSVALVFSGVALNVRYNSVIVRRLVFCSTILTFYNYSTLYRVGTKSGKDPQI